MPFEIFVDIKFGGNLKLVEHKHILLVLNVISDKYVIYTITQMKNH